MAVISEALRQRDREEIMRSHEEAQETILKRCEVDRYLAPSANCVTSLEYVFHLLGDVDGKTVLDLGCGNGESVVILVHKRARVTGMDISPELIELARRRVEMQCASFSQPQLLVRSAYDTGLPDSSVDVVLSNVLLHHLDLPTALQEIRRILKADGRLIFREPVRLLRIVEVARRLFPPRPHISCYEHPLTRTEYDQITNLFNRECERAFRLPFVPVAIKLNTPQTHLRRLQRLDSWLLTRFSVLCPLATMRVAVFMNKRVKDGVERVELPY